MKTTVPWFTAGHYPMPESLPSRTTGQAGKLHIVEAVGLGRAVDARLGLEPQGQI